MLFFSGGIMGIILAVYLGLTFGYQPYLNAAIAQEKSQMDALSNSISSADQANLLTYYSQITNLNTIVASHVFFSRFLTWLAGNTEANVYYGGMSFGSGDQATLSVFAKTQADVNQQIAIFESSPDVSAVSVPGVAFSPTAGMWAFDATLTLKPSLLLWQPANGAAAASMTISTTSAAVAASTTPTMPAAITPTTTFP